MSSVLLVEYVYDDFESVGVGLIKFLSCTSSSGDGVNDGDADGDGAFELL